MTASSSATLTLYTIGHSNVPANKIVALLKQHGIQVLVDVRSSPYSKYVPQFNREIFQSVLEREGLDYKFAGEYLGGRPKDPACYKNRQIPNGHADFLHLVDYPAVMTMDWYQKGIQRLLEIATDKPTAIMCSEEDPARCHRQHLISQTLLARGVEVLHIRSDGRLQKAWLLNEKEAEKPEENPAEQMTFLSSHIIQEDTVIEQSASELIYEPLDDGIQYIFPDGLTEKYQSASPAYTQKKGKKHISKKQEEQERFEKERLQKWIEENKGN
jgi:hypothetical protein